MGLICTHCTIGFETMGPPSLIKMDLARLLAGLMGNVRDREHVPYGSLCYLRSSCLDRHDCCREKTRNFVVKSAFVFICYLLMQSRVGRLSLRTRRRVLAGSVRVPSTLSATLTESGIVASLCSPISVRLELYGPTFLHTLSMSRTD